MTEMRVLTVRQPWAWAIIHGGKDVENRVRNIAGSYRGAVAIHAGLAFDPDGVTAARRHLGQAISWRDTDYDLGAIIGVVDLVGVHAAGKHYQPVGAGLSQIDLRKPACCPPWGIDACVHFKFANPRSLTTPIPFRGALGLRRLDDATRILIEGNLS